MYAKQKKTCNHHAVLHDLGCATEEGRECGSHVVVGVWMETEAFGSDAGQPGFDHVIGPGAGPQVAEVLVDQASLEVIGHLEKCDAVKSS